MASRNLKRLLVDENLIGLTRWLRFLGLDASMAVGWKDREVAAFARRHGRLLITRDAELAEEMGPDPVIRVRSDKPREQLKAVLRETGVPSPDHWFSLCVLCNVQLRELSTAEVATEARVPPFARARPGERFWRCPDCERVYWRGSHYDRTWAFLVGVSAELEAEAS